MRRLIDTLIAASLLVVPAFFVASSAAPTPTAAATSTQHLVALTLQPSSACAPEDPGTL